jgi:hypothetical protein
MKLVESDQIILDHAIRWRHWGGAEAEDIMVEFGLTSVQFYSRLQALLDCRPNLPGFGQEVTIELHELCERHLHHLR